MPVLPCEERREELWLDIAPEAAMLVGLGDLGLPLYPIDECDRFADAAAAAKEMPRPPLEGCGTPELV